MRIITPATDKTEYACTCGICGAVIGAYKYEMTFKADAKTYTLPCPICAKTTVIATEKLVPVKA